MDCKIHGVPFGIPFTDGFLAWFQRTIPAPLHQAQACVLLSTRRAVMALEEGARQSLQASLLPKFIALSDLATENPFQIPELVTLPPVISPIRRYGLLEKLVGAFLAKSQVGQPQASHVEQYVTSLCKVMDELLVHKVTIDQLASWDPGKHGEHFETNFQLLKLILEYWPQILQEQGVVEGQAHTQMCFKLLVDYFQKTPPKTPVILAGSTGSLPATRSLMDSILKLPNGYVVLPGADEGILTQWPLTHPQGGLASLVKALTLKPNQFSFHKMPSAVEGLLQAAFDDNGFILPPNFPKDSFPEMVETTNLLEEARVVALMCRYHLEQKQNVTIVCPDPALQNHISHELLRFHIHPNTSLGEPLARTVVGGFMCDLARLKQQFSPNILFAVLKNPLCFKVCEEGRLAYLEKVRRLELTASRSKAFTLGTLWSEVAEILEKFFKNTNTLENLFQAAYELSCGHKTPSVTFAECPLFQKEDGKALWLFYEELRNQSILGDSQDKLGTFIALMPPVQFYEGLGSSVRILGTLEARLVGDSVVILTSLNEESWPKATPPSCWVPTALRTHLGLPPLESFIGLAAHDFASCFHGNLYITRSRESRGKTQEPSRFWQRLQAVAEKNDVRPSKNPWLLLAQQHHVPLESLPLKAPAPCPPQNTRPTHITISDVNLLVKDPYGFYAKTCLRLTPLPPLEGKKNDTMKRGNLVHSLLEYALKNSTDSIKHEMIRLFQKHGLKNAFWGQQFLRIVQWAYNDLKKRGNVEHFLEQQGEMTLSVDNKSIVVKGRADRIDSIEKGKHVCIIDYKTGTLPTIKDVHQGYAPQLPLEALMLHKGAFHESLTYVNSLELWHVRGFEPVVDVKKLTVDSDFLKHSHNGFLLLLKTFLCEETPFLACPNPKKAPTLKDYNHLERLEEWQQWAQF